MRSDQYNSNLNFIIITQMKLIMVNMLNMVSMMGIGMVKMVDIVVTHGKHNGTW